MSVLNEFENIRRPVVVLFDSGVGGLAYVPSVTELLPRASIIYIADNAHFPYGERDDREVTRIVVERMASIVDSISPDVVVLACNTASVVALSAVRREYPGTSFVGVVPAVKPAANVSRSGRIGVLATSRTVSGAYLDRLVDEYAAGCVVERIAGGELVRFVEYRLPDAGAVERAEAVEAAIARFRDLQVDTAVLACTHFVHLEREIAAAFGGEVRVVDSRDGVARRVRDIVERREVVDDEIPSNEGSTDRLLCMCTTATDDRYARFADLFGLDYGGVFTPVRTREKLERTADRWRNRGGEGMETEAT